MEKILLPWFLEHLFLLQLEEQPQIYLAATLQMGGHGRYKHLFNAERRRGPRNQYRDRKPGQIYITGHSVSGGQYTYSY